MNGQPHGFLFGMRPIHAVARIGRNKHVLSCFKIEAFPVSLEEKLCPAAQDEHPFCCFRIKPFAFRSRLPERNDPLDPDSLAFYKSPERFPFFCGGEPGKKIIAFDPGHGA